MSSAIEVFGLFLMTLVQIRSNWLTMATMLAFAMAAWKLPTSTAVGLGSL